MNCLRHIPLAFFAAISIFGLSAVRAQSLDAFKRQLAQPDSLSGARVQVTEHGSAAQTVRYLENRAGDEKIRGYRVRIFSDNSQSARTNAASTVTRFRELFPGIPVYMVYENPYWKVTVGNCRTSEEAIILMARVKNDFDRAFLMQEQIPVGVFAE